MAPKQPLSVTHPDLAAQAYGWDPSIYFPQKTRVEWKCHFGHTWTSTIEGRVGKDQTGCPVCSGRIVQTGFNDLETLFPYIASEAHGWDPKLVSAGSNRKYPWKCEKGHVYEASVDKRTGKYKTGCPFCRNLKLLVGFNDLATTHSEIASQAYGWDPSSVVFGTDRKLAWKCHAGHIWKAPVNSRDRNNCPVCSNQEIRPGVNDIGTTHPEIAKEAIGWDPSIVSAGNTRPRQWICHLGHVYSKTPANKILRGDGCPVCSGRKLLTGFNDLQTTHPDLARQANGWDPTLITRGSNRSVLWTCEEGHEWRSTISNRTGTMKSGCPTCAKTGFDPNSKGWIYFLRHPEWQMLQIGITNDPDTRLRKHSKLGWSLVDLRGPMEGLIARKWETSILQMLKRHGAQLARKEVAGTFDGYTESWMQDSYPCNSLHGLMEAVRTDEDNE